MGSETAQFLMHNLGVMGFMFFLFIYGVKIDPNILRRTGKLHVATALVGIIPTGIVFAVGLSMRKNMDEDMAKVSSLGVIAGFLGTTSFPVLYHILKEFNLLNSDVGRVALSTAVIGDTIGLSFILIFEAAAQGEVKMINALWYLICVVLMMSFLAFCVRPALIWINKNTPDGHPVQETAIVATLLGTFVMGFLSDLFGLAIANGPLFLGLAIPDGPHVGATLENKTSTIISDFLLPFSFILVGSYTDINAMTASGWSNLSPLFILVLVGYFLKFFTTWITLHLLRVPFRDGLTLSLILSLRGQVELILFVHWLDKSVSSTFNVHIFVYLSLV